MVKSIQEKSEQKIKEEDTKSPQNDTNHCGYLFTPQLAYMMKVDVPRKNGFCFVRSLDTK